MGLRMLFLAGAALVGAASLAPSAQADWYGGRPPGYVPYGYGYHRPYGPPPGPGPWGGGYPRYGYGYGYRPPPPPPPFYLGRPPIINRPPPIFVPAPGFYYGY